MNGLSFWIRRNDEPIEPPGKDGSKMLYETTIGNPFYSGYRELEKRRVFNG